ncbi:KRAB [Mytilus coruscus]|uniref:KRAB n=1 Tax=Mytilus coruscus TaxID=42192 RepID=A0A6J8AJY5_MYTCO|nr:KRAB [Mytilus coruscus]
MVNCDHLSPLGDYLYQLYKSQILCDLSIITRTGTTVLAHKLVVAAFSGGVRTEVEKWKDLPQMSIVVEYQPILTRSNNGDDEQEGEVTGITKEEKGTISDISEQTSIEESNEGREITVITKGDKGTILDISDLTSIEESNEEREKTVKTNDVNGDCNSVSGKVINGRNLEMNKSFNCQSFEMCDDLGVKDDDTSADIDDCGASWEDEIEVIDDSPKRIDSLGEPRDTDKTFLRKTDQNNTHDTSGHAVKATPILVKDGRNKYTLDAEHLTDTKKDRRKRYTLDAENLTDRKKDRRNRYTLDAQNLTDTKKERIRYDRRRPLLNQSQSLFGKMKPTMKKFKKKNLAKSCDKSYLGIRGLATHLIEKHKLKSDRVQKLTGYPKYFKYKKFCDQKCNECGIDFDSLSDFRAHCRSVHKKKQLDLDIACTYENCSEKFLLESELNKHIIEFHEIHEIKSVKHMTLRHSEVKVSRGVDRHDLTTQGQKQGQLIETSAFSVENVEKKNKERTVNEREKFSKAIESQTSSYQKKNFNNVSLPSKKNRCYKCPKSSVCGHNSASLHLKEKHGKLQLRQRSIYSRIEKHVNMRSSMISRESCLRKVQVELNEENRTCDKCDKTFSSVGKVFRHLKRAKYHTDNQPLKSTGYPRKVDVKKKTMTCMDCQRSFTNLRNLSNHLQSIHKYTFELAREATGYPSFVKVIEQTKKVSKCQKCSEVFPTMKDLKTHTVAVHGIPCKFCDARFLHPVSLKRHGFRNHREHIKEFQMITYTSDKERTPNEACEGENFSKRLVWIVKVKHCHIKRRKSSTIYYCHQRSIDVINVPSRQSVEIS